MLLMRKELPHAACNFQSAGSGSAGRRGAARCATVVLAAILACASFTVAAEGDAVVIPAPFHAQAAEERALRPGDELIPLDQWRALTRGKTVWYSLDGAHWGREYYHPDRDVATFITRDGDCVTAPWVHARGLFCFSYQGLECFRHFRRDSRIMVAPLSGGALQQVERIDAAPLSCDPPLSS